LALLIGWKDASAAEHWIPRMSDGIATLRHRKVRMVRDTAGSTVARRRNITTTPRGMTPCTRGLAMPGDEPRISGIDSQPNSKRSLVSRFGNLVAQYRCTATILTSKKRDIEPHIFPKPG
jgi:hypothetical protein